MTEQALEQAAAPVLAAILEDLHAYASQELTHLGNTMPALLRSASQDVQDAFTTLEQRYHALIARIDAHRNGQVPPGFTAAPTTAPTSTPSSTASKPNSPTAASTATDTTTTAK
jgi:hypothetical protein